MNPYGDRLMAPHTSKAMDSTMKAFGCCMSAWVLVGIVCSVVGAKPFTGSPQDTLHPQMVRLLEERGPSKGWVFFKDKGLASSEALSAALQDARLNLHPRALERRRVRRSAPGDVDLRDVPVHRPYVETVLATASTAALLPAS